MSISIRDSIRWLPDPASEPTSTIVLTSPEHRFVDIRILKSINGDGLSGHLDWAFAGVSSSETRNGVRHCTWRHVVDGRTRTPEEVVDEGDIYPQDDGRTLETGRMMNPDTGKITDYEEIWRDLEPEAIPEDTDEQPRARCVVLGLEDEERGGRGIVVCLGQHCQGIMRQGASFTAERWQWINGEWRLEFRVGELCIPGPEHIYTDVISSQNKHIRCENTLQKWDVIEMSYV